MPIITKYCEICGNQFSGERWYVNKTRLCSRSCQVKELWVKGKIKTRKGFNLSQETKDKISMSLRNEKHFAWKVKPTYGIVHYWLRQNYGKPNKCLNLDCKGISTRYEWALIKGRKYIRKRENFMRLCRSCHAIYDRNKNICFNTDN